MHWTKKYHLFLFDFDGILVNTEKLHYLAYKTVCEKRGFPLPWSMEKYLSHAMYSATALKEAVYKEFPDLQQQEPDWRVLYEEKKKAYTELFEEEGVELMPGVEELLEKLAKEGKKRCVVTHSAKAQVDAIRKMLPSLNSIPYWLTREDYSEPKPSPECYQKAIELYGDKEDQVIGFEDSPRGLKALIGSGAKSVLLSELISREEADSFTRDGVTVASSFSSLTKKWDG